MLILLLFLFSFLLKENKVPYIKIHKHLTLKYLCFITAFWSLQCAVVLLVLLYSQFLLPFFGV